jgi:hypothetical protein
MAKKFIELIEEKLPAHARADIPPTEGYSVEVDGKLKSHFPTSEGAFEAGVEIKKKFPFVQVRIYDAKERTRTPVELP